MGCLSNTTKDYIYMAASLLSILGSALVIGVLGKTKLYHCYSFKLLLYISVNDLFRGLIGLLLVFFMDISGFCVTSAYLLYSLSLSNYIWAACITFTIYQIIVLEETEVLKYYKNWVLSAYCLPLSLDLLPFITSSYVNKEDYCELNFDLIGSIWRFTIVYLPTMIILIFIMVLFIRIYKKAKIFKSFSAFSIVIERGLIYSIIIALFEFPLFAIRVIQAFYYDCVIEYFFVGFTFLFLLQGFFNAVAFFMNKTVIKSFKKEDDDVFRNSLINDSLSVSFRSNITMP